ncbi:CHY zinc finger domain-containing protein [Pleurostoma richardsiae]|uniref:CHY zinc finger domain-containing protein n=1 Tax=Pleurostoma richardsiae TaxID=41990 RepID=A0AA38RZR1_9PEZI|nr:CHY zinc finger domain-containing protein [Pleurostoma richardsiae]
MISTKNRPDGLASQSTASPSRRQAASEVPHSRVVPKPVPKSQVQDAREYQIGQIRKRYSPKESIVNNGAATSLVFNLTPSDPDFPFELAHLECDLRVPKHYPKAPASLSVRNKDIPRGFGINIEKGWDKLVQERKGATLLSLTHALDKNLESFLSEKQADTVKLTIFKDTRHIGGQPREEIPAPTKPAPAQPTAPKAEPRRPYVPEASFTKDQIAEAKARRAQETRQVEARMGRMVHYHRSNDGIVYTLPIEPKRRAELPEGLRGVQSFQLIVPLLYPLQAIRILLNDVQSEDAELVEELFMQKAVEKKEMSLMSHINYLTQNIHVLAKQARSLPKSNAVSVPVSQGQAPESVPSEKAAGEASTTTEDKAHIHVIPRPPEWSQDQGSGSSGESDSYDSELSEEDGDGGAALTSDQPAPVQAVSSSSTLPSKAAERGIAMSFPSIELYGIELLQVSILSISVKCERCRTVNEVGGLRDGVEKTDSCRKCAAPFAVRFRQELVHQNSARAGFIDAAGCTVADLLPSTFVPTCARCSTPSQGLVSVRGETTTNVCRECHARFTFKIPDVRFLAFAPGGLALPPTTGPRRRQERLGLHAGEPLPGRGACAHYRRSYRWFRFSCCRKVYACDRCHDEAEDHPNEWANRMICGFCSREQNYAVEACAFCGRSVVGKRGRGFWEGGRGTRDQVLMSRKDKRKYRRVGGSEGAK